MLEAEEFGMEDEQQRNRVALNSLGNFMFGLKNHQKGLGGKVRFVFLCSSIP